MREIGFCLAYCKSMNTLKRTLALSVLLCSTTFFLVNVSAQISPVPVPVSSEATSILEHIKFLAGEECAGRAPGTQGNTFAAEYIEQFYKKENISVMQQPFSMTTAVKLGASNSVIFDVIIEKPGIPLDQTKPTKISWKLGTDYQPYGFSESGTVTAPLVFVGYGISTTDGQYNDYDGVDVKGKIVIMMRGVPDWAKKDEKFNSLASLRTKLTAARDKGAAAVCFVNQAGDSADVLSPFGMDRLSKNSGILALQVRRTPCARIFPPKGTSLFVGEQTIEKTKKPFSFQLTNTTATITTALEFTESKVVNVIAEVPGTNPSLANEYIVVGAHFDHLGMGDEHSLAANKTPQIHPGADDNASGTAGLLELAKRIKAQPLSRPVLFMSFNGEEKGLLGSKYYVANPTKPLNQIVAMLNMDMIGRMTDNKLNIQGTGTSAVWPGIIEAAKNGLNLTLSTTADGFGPSDHSSFTAKEIPVLFFFSGLHSDYHRPTDTWDKINANGAASIITMVERVARAIGDAPTKPTFTVGASTPKVSSSASSGFKVTFGVIPDYSDDPQGLRITGVKEGSPAQSGGLKGDDIITKFGSTTVKNIYDLMSAMEASKPGDVVEVTVIRNKQNKTMKVTLTGKQ